MMRVLFILLVVLLNPIVFISCNDSGIPKLVKKNLRLAGDNKNELLRVINYYKENDEQEKLEATYYLISNMHNKYVIHNKNIHKKYNLLEEVNTLKKEYHFTREQLNSILLQKQDSLRGAIGSIEISENNLKPDLQAIKSNFLIKNIDQAFIVWDKPWAQHISFSEFCEFILPYRIYNEPLSNWRDYLYEKYIHFEDSLNDPSDPKELVTILSFHLYDQWNHLESFNANNLYPDLISMHNYTGGQCEQRYFLFTAMCRSLGLPVGIDMTSQWTTSPRGHSWNTLVDTNGRVRPFNGAEDNMRFYDNNVIPMGDGNMRCTKYFGKLMPIKQKHLTCPIQKF